MTSLKNMTSSQQLKARIEGVYEAVAVAKIVVSILAAAIVKVKLVMLVWKIWLYHFEDLLVYCSAPSEDFALLLVALL